MLPFRLLPVLSVVVLSAVTPAYAQVTVDLHALQALPGQNSAPAPTRVTPRPAQRPAVRPLAEATTPGAEKSESAPAPVATANPAVQPALPQSVPVTASIAPIPPAPEAAPPPPAPPVSANAATVAEPTQSGLRLTFAPGQSDLSPESVSSIKKLADGAPSGDAVSFNVLAYAPGSANDPSTARRVSLSRAMAVRSALVGDGVSSARIYVRALGEQFGSGPPDRVDVTVLGANAGSQSASQAAPK
jgi:outer membrane protein OmpA-like peptidoglycan-associated protein